MSLIFGHSAGAASQEELKAWNDAKRAGDANAYFRYLSQFPAGEFIREAVDALGDLGAVKTRQLPRASVPTGGGDGDNQNVPSGAYGG